MRTMPTFSVESKTLRDVMHFSSKHADDVVRGVGGSGRTERNLEAVLEKAKKGEPVSTYQERLNQTPVNEGHWTGERGESTFVSNKDEVRKILDDVNLEGIEYENAIPDFSPVSKGEVKITDMGIDRNANFRQADELLARELGKTRREIVKFRKENKLTWHELNDMTSMQLVPSIINSKFGHLGGVSEVKKLLELLQ
ncbi:HNH endonuclease [Streptococcus sp. SM3]|uniref:HNH endonuclease n=1 Tax=Streptococcus sp. SM3 TaxID=2898231 RepID=UPI0022B7A710|nr:HNH endonuclease [Streptococcus sp. SM3]